MPENLPLWFDDIYGALRGFVSYAGGSKVVGPKVFPHKAEEKAAAWLDDCLNPDRAAKLDPEQFLLMLRLAREARFHGLMAYVGDYSDYEVTPKEPQDALASLYSQFVESVGEVKKLSERIERAQARLGREGRTR